MQTDLESVIGASVIQDRDRPGNTTSQGLLLNLLTESGANSLLS